MRAAQRIRSDYRKASAGLEQSVHAAANQIARSTGFHTQRHRVDLVGLCARCA
jgi:Fe2+ or Zn2+ uptake regulation protein